MLRHHIHKRSHDLAKVSKPGWRRLGFPLMYQTDVLEILGILTTLGYRDERMQEALRLVAGKADAQGRWKLESTFNDRFPRADRGQGRAEPLGDLRGTAGAQGGMSRNISRPASAAGRCSEPRLGR